MILEKLLPSLSKYQGHKRVDEQKVTVYLGLSQELSVDFSNTAKVKIKNTFKAHWNPLNSMILMSFKGTVLFNGIGVLVFSLL